MSLPAQSPSFLKAEIAESYRTSIRISADGLAFLLFDSNGQEVHQANLQLELGYPNLSTAVSELFFRHPFLSFPYKSTTIYYSPISYVLVPLDLYEEDKRNLWLSTLFEKDDEPRSGSVDREILSHKFEEEGKVLLASYDKALLQFLRRTLLVFDTVPYFVPLIRLSTSMTPSHLGKKLHLFLDPHGIDAVLTESSQLSFAIRYPLTETANTESKAQEVLFYLFSLWRALSLDTSQDSLRIEPQNDTMNATADHLRSLARLFISQID